MLKITNTKYMLIHSESGNHKTSYTTINWRNVFIALGVVGLIAVHLIGWYL